MGDNRAASVTLVCTNPKCEITYAAIVSAIHGRRCICGGQLKPVEPKAKAEGGVTMQQTEDPMRLYFQLANGRVITVIVPAVGLLRPTPRQITFAIEVREIVSEHFDEIACVQIPTPTHARIR